MKKKILLSLVIFVSVFFSFEIKGKAVNTTCSYNLNLWDDWYLDYRTYINVHYFGKNAYNVKKNFEGTLSILKSAIFDAAMDDTKLKKADNSSVELLLEFDDNKLLDNIPYTDVHSKMLLKFGNVQKVMPIYNNTHGQIELKNGQCPDLVVMNIEPYYTNEFAKEEAYHYLATGLYLKDYENNIDAAMKAAESYDASLKTPERYDESIKPMRLIFTSDANKPKSLTATAAMYGRSKIINSYYGVSYTQIYNDIDPIIQKYLDLGWGPSLNDMVSANSETYDEILQRLVKNIIKLDVRENDLAATEKILNAIEDEFKALKEFYEAADNMGIRSVLNKYLSDSGFDSSFDSTEWFNTYGPNEKSQYADSLLEVLGFVYQYSDYYRIKMKFNEYSNELADKEKNDDIQGICEKYDALDLYCRVNNMNYETAVNACKRQYISLEKYCEQTYDELISSIDIANNSLDAWEKQNLTNYVTNIISQKGIDIDNTDFCDILKTDLIDYIKIVMNIIRIGGPVLIVFLTAFDAIKMIASFKEDESKKFWKNLKIRLICLVILILVPTIVNWIVKLVIEGACIVEF